MRSALEDRLKIELPADRIVFTWLFEYAAPLLNKAEVGHDGKTAYEQNKGKQGRICGVDLARRWYGKGDQFGWGAGEVALFVGGLYFLGK